MRIAGKKSSRLAVLIGFLAPAGIALAQTATADQVDLGADLSTMTQEVSNIKEGSTATEEAIDSTDQRLMDAERALLESLTKGKAEESDPEIKAALKEVPAEPVKEAPVDEVTKSEKAEPEVFSADEEAGFAPLVEITAVADSSALPSDTEASASVKKSAKSTKESAKVIVKDDPSELGSLRVQNANLRRENDKSTGRVQALLAELDDAKRKLVVSETEVMRLSSIIEAKKRTSLDRYNMRPINSGSTTASKSIAPAREENSVRQPPSEVRPPNPSNDMPVATVVVDKADLRLGPGKNHSPLMSVPRGSRLVVEARQGEWYRVFAPNGERAWISSSLVRFGPGAVPGNQTSTSKVKGYDSELEEEAFRRLSRHAHGS